MPARTWPRRGRRKRALCPNDVFQVMRRRFLIGASLSLVVPPAWGQAEKPVRFSVTGALQQGSLAMGSAPPGSLVALDGRPLRVAADGRFVFGVARGHGGGVGAGCDTGQRG